MVASSRRSRFEQAVGSTRWRAPRPSRRTRGFTSRVSSRRRPSRCTSAARSLRKSFSRRRSPSTHKHMVGSAAERVTRLRTTACTTTFASTRVRFLRGRSRHFPSHAPRMPFGNAGLVTAVAFQGLLVGRFVIEREVGRGGVRIVYRARDEVSSAPVALKVIAIPGVDTNEEARFGREGRVLAGLNHPGIVRVVAFGQLDEGHPYVAMEWLEGEDIAQRQKRAPLAFVRALQVAAQVADSLAYAHSVGIVHRDIKPSNVILVGSGPQNDWPLQAKLVDFGVASAEDARLTRTGAIIGTPAYMAPEQARGDAEVDARADIYGLGATLFEMIAGRPPHMGPTPIAILARLVTTPAPRLGEVFGNAPVPLDDLLWEMLSTHPEDRPERAADVATRLRAIAAEMEHAPLTTRGQSPDAPMSTGSMVLTSSRPGGSRLVTSILATHVPKGAPRHRLIAHLRARGAEATELGGDAIVAHLGVKKALGDEAVRALDLGLRLAKMGARVGVATGRTRIDRTRPTGEVVDRAAALARDAQKGQVFADTTTGELARGRFEMQVRPDGTSIVGPKHVQKKD